jgi:hypothetical protein
VAKSAKQLEREIAQSLGLPSVITKKWRSKVAAYKRAIAKLEEGYSDDLFYAAVRARNVLDKTISEATAYVPYDPAKPAYLSDAIQALERERKELVSSTWEQAKDRGREANRRAGEEEIKRLREEEREARRPYEWMRR